MFISLILLIVFALISSLFHFNSKLFRGFIISFTGIFIVMIASILFSIKFSVYMYYNDIDNFLYFIFSNLHIKMNVVSYIYNLGMAIIMFSMTYTVVLVSNIKKALPVASVITIILFLVVTSPDFTEYLFYGIHSFTPTTPVSFYTTLEKLCNWYSCGIFIIHLILPLLIFLRDYFRSKAYINKRRLITPITAQFTIVVFLLYYYLVSIHSAFAPWNMDLLKFPRRMFSTDFSFGMIPSTLLLFSIIFILSVFFNPFEYFKITTKKKYARNSKKLNHNLRMILHSNKNILVTVEKLAEQAIDLKELNPQILISNLNDIQSIASNGLNHISKIIDLINDVSPQTKDTDIIKCIETAIQSINFNGIAIERKYAFDIVILKLDPTHITECFINLFQNCIEAIAHKGNTDGKIQVSVNIELPYVYIDITDNGCGIPKNEINDIFSPLSSSKKSAKNWGMGLNYVENIMNLYGGNIDVKSVVDSHTTFQLSFPYK